MMKWSGAEHVDWGGAEHVDWGGAEHVDWGGAEHVDWGGGMRRTKPCRMRPHEAARAKMKRPRTCRTRQRRRPE